MTSGLRRRWWGAAAAAVVGGVALGAGWAGFARAEPIKPPIAEGQKDDPPVWTRAAAPKGGVVPASATLPPTNPVVPAVPEPPAPGPRTAEPPVGKPDLP